MYELYQVYVGNLWGFLKHNIFGDFRENSKFKFVIFVLVVAELLLPLMLKATSSKWALGMVESDLWNNLEGILMSPVPRLYLKCIATLAK